MKVLHETFDLEAEFRKLILTIYQRTKKHFQRHLWFHVRKAIIVFHHILSKKGADVNISHNNYTALKAACEGNSLSIIKCLIEHGASPNEVIDTNGMTILHYACKISDTKIVKYLISKNADVNSITNGKWQNGIYEEGYMMPIHYACIKGSKDTVSLLHQHKATLNHETYDEKLPIHFACESGSVELVRHLIMCSADINCPSYGGKVPLHYAIEKGHNNLTQYLLLNGANSSIVTNDNMNPLCFATMSGKRSIIKTLIKYAPSCIKLFVDSAIRFALQSSTLNVPIIEELMEQENVNLIDPDQNGKCPVHIICEHKSKELLQQIISKNIDINAVNNEGRTPLHICCMNTWCDGVKTLIEHGANSQIEDSNKKKPSDLTENTEILFLL